jgi:hypothetical protein
VLLSPESGWFGKGIAAFPIGVVLQFLNAADTHQQRSEETEMLLRLLNGDRGRMISDFLVSLRRDGPYGRDLAERDDRVGMRKRASLWVGQTETE